MIDQGELFDIPSPCKRICVTNNRGYCKGCFRSRDERLNWLKYSDFQRQLIINLCEKRRLKVLSAKQNPQTEEDADEWIPQADLFAELPDNREAIAAGTESPVHSEAETLQPVTTVPNTSAPDTSEADTSEADISAPDTSEPGTSVSEADLTSSGQIQTGLFNEPADTAQVTAEPAEQSTQRSAANATSSAEERIADEEKAEAQIEETAEKKLKESKAARRKTRQPQPGDDQLDMFS
tara:strand:- start:66 stop:776 length:711 start_codon:yes stop_codon:yes gene_type:complete